MLLSCAGMHGDANVDCVAVWFPSVTVRKMSAYVFRNVRRTLTVEDYCVPELGVNLLRLKDCTSIPSSVVAHCDDDILRRYKSGSGQLC